MCLLPLSMCQFAQSAVQFKYISLEKAHTFHGFSKLFSSYRNFSSLGGIWCFVPFISAFDPRPGFISRKTLKEMNTHLTSQVMNDTEIE